MQQGIFNTIIHRTLLLFIIGFIISLPFHYTFLPNIGKILRPFFEGFNANFMNAPESHLHSDSLLMVSNTITIFLLSAFISIVWTLIRKDPNDRIHFWIYRLSAYYLSLTLLIYGCTKIFKYQFFFPEPNTLFTPLGQLSPDILYWSAMGTSHSYSIFAGVIEIIPAILLLFRKTRMLGAFIALGVLTNVMMLNIGFGIEVKIYTGFLIGLSLLLLQPHFKRLYAFFIVNAASVAVSETTEPTSNFYKKARPFIKVILIGFLLLESSGPYVIKAQFNGDSETKIYMHGAYNVAENPLKIKRIFVHNASYFILQTKEDAFIDYEMSWNLDILTLRDYEGKTCNLNLSNNIDGTFKLSGLFFETIVVWNFERIDLERLAIYDSRSSA